MIKSILLKTWDSENRLALVFSVLVFTIYALYPTKTFYWDGIIYSKYIEDVSGFGAQLFHPNHLFYNVAGYIAYQTARVFDPSSRAVSVLQILNSFFGVLSAIVLFFILK